jgi:putative ABC transport system permease protein
MANAIEQIGAVTAMNIRNIPERWSSSLVAVLGIGGVTLVLVALLSIGAGFRAALEGSGSEDVAMIMRAGAPSEMGSFFDNNAVTAITNAPNIQRNAKKELMISPEVFGVVAVPLRGKDTDAQLPFRGVGPMAVQLRKEFKVVQGRMFKPGTTEIVVGDGAAQQYVGLDVGKKVRWLNTDWEIVGRFTDDGGLAESEAWADAPVLQQAWRRGPTFQTIRAKLAQGTSLKALKDVLTKNPQLTVDVTSEKQFYVDQQKAMSKLINNIGLWIGIIMGLAALFAALNTLESAVASRVREIATLRAMGFGAGPVVFSVLVEAMILGAIGGLVGGVVAFLFLNGITSSTLNFASFSQITYAFTVTPLLLLLGIAYGLALCLLAGILPGIRAARMPITSGLREL